MTLEEVVALLVVVAAASCALHALMTKTREPTSALAWILVCLTLPGLGVILYLTVGQARLVTRKRFQVRLAAATFQARMADRERRLGNPLSQHIKDQVRWLQRLNDAPVVGGNELRALMFGEQVYPAMLEEIRGAGRRIMAQFYIMDDDATGRRFLEALAERAREGVEVRVVYDAIGSHGTPGRYWEELRRAGGRAIPFMPLSPIKRRWQINLRNHKKLLVVDGRVAFTGSINISDRHLVESGGGSRDLGFRIQGPAVTVLEQSFEKDWFFAAGEDRTASYDPAPPEPAGEHLVQVVESGPDRDVGEIYFVLVSAIHRASRSIHIVTPYFVPDLALLNALEIAVYRGVEVVLVLPQRSDHRLVDLARLASLQRLLRAGATVYERPGDMVHMKLVVLDDELTITGSTNLDNRSLFLNFELDLVVPGEGFARRTRELIEAEIAESHYVSPLRDLHPPFHRRFLVRLASLFSPVL